MEYWTIWDHEAPRKKTPSLGCILHGKSTHPNRKIPDLKTPSNSPCMNGPQLLGEVSLVGRVGRHCFWLAKVYCAPRVGVPRFRLTVQVAAAFVFNFHLGKAWHQNKSATLLDLPTTKHVYWWCWSLTRFSLVFSANGHKSAQTVKRPQISAKDQQTTTQVCKFNAQTNKTIKPNRP